MSVFDRQENFVSKEENAGYRHFHQFPNCFQKVSSSRLLKVGLCGKGLNVIKVFFIDNLTLEALDKIEKYLVQKWYPQI